jgi:hypothetical protein
MSKAHLVANLRFYQKVGREVANAFRYDFPEEAYSFAVEQLKQLARYANSDGDFVLVVQAALRPTA